MAKVGHTEFVAQSSFFKAVLAKQVREVGGVLAHRFVVDWLVLSVLDWARTDRTVKTKLDNFSSDCFCNRFQGFGERPEFVVV